MHIYDEISVIQYELMLVTIGFDRDELDNNVFKMWKNIYQEEANIIDNDWQQLITLGLAKSSLSVNNKYINYSLTKNGIDFISNREGIKVNYNHFI